MNEYIGTLVVYQMTPQMTLQVLLVYLLWMMRVTSPRILQDHQNLDLRENALQKQIHACKSGDNLVKMITNKFTSINM